MPLLQPLWQARGRLREGLAWFDAALADLDAQHPGVAPAVHEFTGGRVQACLGHRDAVQGGVELPIPVRDSRCRCLFDDQTGRGAVPLCRAKASLERNRCTRAVSPTILAAVNEPQPRWPTAGNDRDAFGDLGGQLVDLDSEHPQVFDEPQCQSVHQRVVAVSFKVGPRPTP